jgi:hypothetical protein
MKTFLVTWEIDIEARDHDEAARKAFEIMQREGTSATCFAVQAHDEDERLHVDLLEVDEEGHTDADH